MRGCTAAFLDAVDTVVGRRRLWPCLVSSSLQDYDEDYFEFCLTGLLVKRLWVDIAYVESFQGDCYQLQT